MEAAVGSGFNGLFQALGGFWGRGALVLPRVRWARIWFPGSNDHAAWECNWGLWEACCYGLLNLLPSMRVGD